MQAKDLWCVHKRKVVNRLPEQLNGLALRDAVALVEGKGLQEHVFTKPDLRTKCVRMMSARLWYPIVPEVASTDNDALPECISYQRKTVHRIAYTTETRIYITAEMCNLETRTRSVMVFMQFPRC